MKHGRVNIDTGVIKPFLITPRSWQPSNRPVGGAVTGTYYVIRNTLTIPAGLFGGVLYAVNPVVVFGTATVVGLVGTGYFLLFGEDIGLS